jgi:hypothetical protein
MGNEGVRVWSGIIWLRMLSADGSWKTVMYLRLMLHGISQSVSKTGSAVQCSAVHLEALAGGRRLWRDGI